MNLARLKRVAVLRLRSLLRADRAEAELAGEFAFHLEQLVRENIDSGMSSSEAHRAARRKLGNVALLEEQCRDQRRVSWLRDLKQDVLYGLRMVRKSPGFTVIAAGSLALGIGANTAILGVADAMLFGKLPYRDADRLVMIRTYSGDNPGQNYNVSLPDFFALQDGTQSFESIGCSLDDQKNLGGVSKQTSPDEMPPERIFGQGWSPGLFETLRVQPLLGRTFTDADYHRGPPSVVILSYRLWQRRFDSDPKILGTHIALNGASTEIIGVMPRDFRFAEERPDYWVPMQITRTALQAGVRYFIVAARVQKGVTVEQAQAEVDRAAAQLAADFPDTHTGWGVRVQPLREALFGWTRPAIFTLEAAVAMVLLIACANVAGLLLARGASRRQEMAMRAALGAGRLRIVRQLLAESLMLSCIGGLLGVAVAWTALRALPAINPPPDAPRLEAIPLNLHMLVLTGFTSLATGWLFGIGPAWSTLRQDLTGALKESGRLRNRQRGRSVLVAAQIAIAFVLLIGSGLLLKSFARLAGRELNFDPHGLLTFEFRLPTWQFQRIVGSHEGFPETAVDPATAPKFERILDRLRALPGTESVAGISSPPVNSILVATMTVTVEGARADSGETSYFLITPRFFETMKTPIVRGREFEESDTAGAIWVAVVNETAAARLWPGEDPIGKRFTADSGTDDRPREVIGVVRDIPIGTRQIKPGPVIYMSYLQQPPRSRLPWSNMRGQMTYLLRGANPTGLAQAAQKAVAEIDPDIPLANIGPMERYTGAYTGGMFYYTAALGTFAALATLLAAIGIYGVMSYHVAQRTHEIGIRMALGARPFQVFGLVGGRTITLVATGLALGFAGALALTRFLASQLWQVTPTDPTAYTGALLLVAVVAGLSCIGPLRRCVRIDPVRALRGE
jgi:putative ABC transport system permease protein